MRVVKKYKRLVPVHSKGRTYYYIRIENRPNVPVEGKPGDPGFDAAYHAAYAKATGRAATGPAKGTLAYLATEYKASGWWKELKPATRVSYQRALAVLMPYGAAPVGDFTRPKIIKLRDARLMPDHGQWMANYAVTVLGILFKFGMDHGLVTENPLAEKVRKIRKAKGKEAANRPWAAEERAAVLAEAPAHVRLVLALAMCTGLRKADVFAATLSAIKDGEITVRTSKRDKFVTLPIHPLLADALAHRTASQSVQIAVRADGLPYTPDGFDTVWHRFRARLEAEQKVAPGLTLHGLRHTLATMLKEAGMEDGKVADVLGQSGTAMSRHYGKKAKLPEETKATILVMDFQGRK